MILAGDVGGTKTVLAIYSKEKGVAGGALCEERYASGEHESFEEIIQKFLEKAGVQPSGACFGVAGPVHNQTSQITNLPWRISGATIGEVFGIERVKLLNDLEAIAHAVPHLSKEDLFTLNEGTEVLYGNKAIVAPGTGLGVAFLVWDGDGYKALASEGGHISFAPGNELEIELLKFLHHKYEHVSYERVCSGSYMTNIYDFFLEKGSYPEPDWLKRELEETSDKTPVIVQAALDHKAAICEATLDVFVSVLGSVTSNMAITILPRGGIYLGGGIPPRILDRLKQPDFMSAVANKGRFFDLCNNMPVHVILTSKAPLYGAAYHIFNGCS